jgi:hypothetical protein
MKKISRREYKVMLDQRMFVDRKEAVAEMCDDLRNIAKRLKKTEFDGKFEAADRRRLCFLDTPDETINLNRFVFRQRTEQSGKTEYTLKCRSADRYVAAGAKLKAGEGYRDDAKFEEDISAPFQVRFSHSNTVAGAAKPPETLGQAAELFPILGKLQRDGRRCPAKLELRPVNSLEAFERVFKGPELKFDKVVAEVALILWSDRDDGRPLVAEFSFRYEDKDEKFHHKAARLAMDYFEELQLLDWCVPEGRTKTQFAYRAAR